MDQAESYIIFPGRHFIDQVVYLQSYMNSNKTLTIYIGMPL